MILTRIKTSELEMQDIDYPEDWKIGEIKYKILKDIVNELDFR